MRAIFVATEGIMSVSNRGTNIIRLNAYLNHSSKPDMRISDGYDSTDR
jgi:hypothetical protein